MSEERITAAPRCPGHQRHWYAYYGWVGSSSPTCVRCGAPNPDYAPERDPRAGNHPRRL